MATCFSQWVYKVGFPIFSPIFRIVTERDLKYHALEMTYSSENARPIIILKGSVVDNVDYLLHLTA